MVFWLSRRHATAFLFGGALTASVMSRAAAAAANRVIPTGASWIVYYGATANDAKLANFDVIVLDPAYTGSIAQCASHGGRTIGYLSFGEVSKTNKWFSFPADSPALLEENPSWPGTHRVDVRQDAWRTAILDGVKRLRKMGFDGLFMDTLDTPPYLEQIDPKRFKGMAAAATDLVKSVRKQWPDMPIIMNRGYALLPDLVNDIDAIVAESLMTTYDGATRAYKWIDPKALAEHIKVLAPRKNRSPELPVLSLDYWNPDDPATIREIYRIERSFGASPYVGTIALDQIVQPPAT
jgi:uncharacterized protein (TIGR01370 family)